MREGLYEVQLVNQHGVPFREEEIDDKSYTHASPGQEFTVKITVHRHPVSGHFPYDCLRVGLFVDGYDVQYWKRMDFTLTPSHLDSVSAVFVGFKKNTADLRAFVFSAPAGATAEEERDPLFKEAVSKRPLGEIKVIIHEAEAVPNAAIFENKSGFHEMPDKGKVLEGKKFWQQASLTTSAGRQINNEKEKFTPLAAWRNKRNEPDVTLALAYHSPDMLRFIHTFTAAQKQRASGAASSSSSGSSGSKRPPELLDLTADDEPAAAAGDNSSSSGGSSSSSNKKAKGIYYGKEAEEDGGLQDSDDDEGEVRVLDKSLIRRDVDLCDMTAEDGDEGGGEAQWQTVQKPIE